MDQKDRAILSCLSKDGRIRMSQIAENVGLTATAVSQRVNKLVEDKVIRGFSVDLDQGKLGMTIQAMISVKLNFPRMEDFNKVLSEFQEIEYCFRVTGEDCIMMKVNLRDNSHLLQFINNMSRYGFTKSSVILEQLV